MPFICFLFNLPWNIIGLCSAALSVPRKITLHANPLAIVVEIRSLWWYEWLPGEKGARAITIGNVIQLSPKRLTNDLQHELIHVKQAQKHPLVQPILYSIETLRHGHKNNRYELEAYRLADNQYSE